MLAQKLRHRITVQRLTTTQASNGAKSEAFATWLQHEPARIEAVSANTLVTANAEWAKVTHRITVRKQAGFKISDRVVDELDDSGIVYDVRGVQPDKLIKLYITLLCESGVNNG